MEVPIVMAIPALRTAKTPLFAPLIQRNASWYLGLVRMMYPAHTMITTMPKSHHVRSTRRRPTGSRRGLAFGAVLATELEPGSAIGYLKGEARAAAGRAP